MTPDPQRVVSRWVRAGLLRPPPAILAEVGDWALEQFSSHVLGVMEQWVEENKKDAPTEQLVEYALVVRAARKYARKGKVQRGKVGKAFPLDFKGWSYMRGDAQWDYDLGTELEVEMYFGTPFADLGGWKFVGEGDTFGKIWLDAFRYLEDLENSFWQLSTFKDCISTLKDTIRHEVSHLGQAALTVLHDTGEVAGLPGLRWRGESYQTVQDLLDDEFYPRLRDEVEMFTRLIKKVPKREWRSAFDEWVRGSGVLGATYQHDRKKWKKAVSEFYKAVVNRGFDF